MPDGDLFDLTVHNLSTTEWLLVDREGFLLITPDGEGRWRTQGGVADHYSVPPSGEHSVRLRFDLSGVRSFGPRARLAISFPHAILVGGKVIALPQIGLTAE